MRMLSPFLKMQDLGILHLIRRMMIDLLLNKLHFILFIYIRQLALLLLFFLLLLLFFLHLTLGVVLGLARVFIICESLLIFLLHRLQGQC